MEDGVVSLFNDQEPIAVDDSVLKELQRLVEKHQILEKEIESVENSLKLKKEELEKVSRVLIPSILNNTGFSELRLKSGQKVIVQDKLKTSIADKNYSMAYRNMINAEGGDENAQIVVNSLFKSKIVIESEEDKLLDYLMENDIPYDSVHTIHPATLTKYCKERLAQGLTIPEGISIFQYQETKITK